MGGGRRNWRRRLERGAHEVMLMVAAMSLVGASPL